MTHPFNRAALENFGSCQSKGFGSFYISGSDANGFDAIENVLKNCTRPVYYFQFAGASDAAFPHIDALYKAMKLGVNETRGNRKSNAYLKSLLWQYLNQGKSCNSPPGSRFLHYLNNPCATLWLPSSFFVGHLQGR